MFRYIFFLVLMSLFTLNANVSDRGPSGEEYKTPYRYDKDKTVNKRYLHAINKMRSKSRNCGKYGVCKATTPLRWSDKLYGAASEHSKDMAKHNLRRHAGSGKSTDITGRKNGRASKTSERYKSHGYTYSKAFALAENVGAGQKSIIEIMKAWMKSPGHCANIMSANFREMGLAKADNHKSKYKTYWTLNLGYRR
ncbi:MAG: CAP domain-containing protein [Campylobacterota bacterium]|nr:CAP domain-containing protein [Campylobacterota bacterium]